MKKSELKQIIREEIKKQLNEDSYHSKSVLEFIKDNEPTMLADDGTYEYYPTIKIFGNKRDSKHLSVTFDVLRKFAKILQNMHI